MPEVNNVVWEVFEEQFMRDPIIRAEVERRSLEGMLRNPSVLQDKEKVAYILNKFVNTQLQDPQIQERIEQINQIRDRNLREKYSYVLNKFIGTNAPYMMLSKVFPHVRMKKELRWYNESVKLYDKLRKDYNEDKKNLYAEAIGKEEGIFGNLEEIVLDNNASREKRENAAEELRAMRTEVNEEKKRKIDKILETRGIEDAETEEKENHVERNTVYGKPLTTLYINGRFFKNKNWYLVPGLGIGGEEINKDNFFVQGIDTPKSSQNLLKKVLGKPTPYLQFGSHKGDDRDTWFLYDVVEKNPQTGEEKNIIKLAKKNSGDEERKYAYYREGWVYDEREDEWDIGGRAAENFALEDKINRLNMPEEYASGKKGLMAISVGVERNVDRGDWKLEEIGRPLTNFWNGGSLYKLYAPNGREYFIDKNVIESAVSGNSWSICDELGKNVVGKIEKRKIKSLVTRRPQYKIDIYDRDLATPGGKMALSLLVNYLDSENIYKKIRYSGAREFHPNPQIFEGKEENK